MKVCETCGDEIATKDGDNQCDTCERNEAESNRKKRNAKAAAARRARHDIMTSLGLTRVRGALGGIYYE